MKKITLAVMLTFVLGISGVSAYGEALNVNWIEANKAEFLTDDSDYVIYTFGDHGEGVLDMQGRDMIKYGQYDSVEESGGFFKTSGENTFYDEESKIGYPRIYNIFYKGASIFPTEEYQYLSVVKEDLIYGQKNGKWGFIKKNGQKAVDFKYDYAEDFNDGVAIVGVLKNENIMYGVIDKNDNVLIPLKYNYVSRLNKGYYLFAKDINGVLKYGLADLKGKELIRAKYDGMFLVEGKNIVVMVKQDDKKKFGIIDINDKLLLDISYDFVGELSDNTYLVGKEEKFGYADAQGKNIIGLQFDAAMNFNEGAAAVKKGSEWSYLDKKGTEIFSLKFEEAQSFYNNHAIVKTRGKYGIINKSGTMAVEAVFDKIIRKNDGNYVVLKGDKFGLLDKNLNSVLSDYQYINSSNNNYLVKKDGKFGIVWNSAPNGGNTSVILSKFNMEIDKTKVENNAYLINNSNYIRLRDMAYLMRDTGAKFSVEYVEELKRIDIEKKKDYKGAELVPIKEFGSGDSISKSKDELYIDGKVYNLDSYNVNGNNYYKLRDLGMVLNFEVDWDNSRKTVSIKTK